MGEIYTCEKCGKTMDEGQFYKYKDGSRTEKCKKCLTMHIDNFDESTYIWLLKKMDVPYIPSEWNILRDRAFNKDPYKMNGMSVFGKYLSKMKLKQFNKYTWEDGEKILAKQKGREAEEAAQRAQFEEKIKQDYENGEISEAEYKTMISTETQYKEMQQTPPNAAGAGRGFFNEQDYIPEEAMVDPSADLTEEDKIFLAMKWGRLYKPPEWVELERHYNEMINSFDIQDADTTSTLVLICKTYLKMNQAVDCGDMDGFQKLSRVYDSLRKSAKFTAAQNKDAKGDDVDSVGELVAMCEREGFIPRFCTDIAQDKVDLTLKDMNNYVHKLVTQDLGFGQQIEDALKKIQIQKEMEEAEELDEELNDIDYEEFYEDVSEQKEKDMTVVMGDES